MKAEGENQVLRNSLALGLLGIGHVHAGVARHADRCLTPSRSGHHPNPIRRHVHRASDPGVLPGEAASAAGRPMRSIPSVWRGRRKPLKNLCETPSGTAATVLFPAGRAFFHGDTNPTLVCRVSKQPRGSATTDEN